VFFSRASSEKVPAQELFERVKNLQLNAADFIIVKMAKVYTVVHISLYSLFSLP